MDKLNMIGLAIAAALAGLTGPARAEVVLDWGHSSTLVSGNVALNRFSGSFTAESAIGPGTDINGDGDTADNVKYAAFSTNTVFSPASGYAGAAFYGGYIGTEVFASPEFNTLQIYNNATADFIYILGRKARISVPVLFPLAGFGKGNEIFGVDAASALTVESLNSFDAKARFLVRNNGTNYVSQALINLGGNNVFTTPASTVLTLSGSSWAVYPPVEGTTALDFTGSSFPVSGSDFKRITMVGFLFELLGNGSGNKFGISSYKADLTVTRRSQGTLVTIR